MVVLIQSNKLLSTKTLELFHLLVETKQVTISMQMEQKIIKEFRLTWELKIMES